MKPNKLETFIYALMKEARRASLMDFLEEWDVSEEEYEAIEEWFKNELGIKL
ncbi:hypothetical protein ABIA69_001921 [Lysinibacillus parviboronicapiens]|uniref:Uncharacterized protein n=1 Tax=Lysinibacillus parviboronicapiens TaxID=436516 RepID=A0ABV2PIJ2_9BACI